MTRPLFPLLLIALLSCTGQTSMTPGEVTNDVLKSRATLNGDKLPIDGCNAHLVLALPDTATNTRPYLRLPSQKTRSLLDKAIQAEINRSGKAEWAVSKAVTILYRETGQTATLTCGWGATQQVKTIDLLAIEE